MMLVIAVSTVSKLREYNQFYLSLIMFYFSGRKQHLKDFADLYSPSKYFPADGEPDLESFGADAYLLCGQFNSNLALLTRTPMLNKRLLGGEKSTKVSLEAALRKQTQGILASGPEGDQFIRELTHLLQDYHDYQSSVRTVARGKLFFFYNYSYNYNYYYC